MADERAQKKLAKGRHVSALKRQRQNETRRERNRATRSRIRTAVRNVETTKTREALAIALPLLDRAVNKGLLPRARASHLTSRLTRLVVQKTA
ncbi:MAG: 30S ribosomal protein S20 [Deltaproteobacteria bacterium]|nr:30S ribosomal protein S20 [Deltaproteobacteria bacterium]